jgi:hypothetical protein
MSAYATPMPKILETSDTPRLPANATHKALTREMK